MTPAAALAAMRARGLVLFLEGGRLRYQAPAGVVTAKTTAYLRRHRDELIALLAEEAEHAPDALRLGAAINIFDAEPVGISQEPAA